MRSGILPPSAMLILASLILAPAAHAQHWEPIGDANAYCCIADPVHARVYFGLAGGIRVYDIPGDSWTNHDIPGIGLYFYDIAWRPDAERLLSAQYTGFFDAIIGASENLGVNWEVKFYGSQVTILDIEHDPTNLERCFALVVDGAILRSLDGGESWNPIYGIPGTKYSMAIDAMGTIYVGTESGILRSEDSGESWQDATGNLPVAAPVGRLEVDPSLPGHLYAGLGGIFQFPCLDVLGLFESFDAGASWTKILDGRIDQLDMHPLHPEILAVDRCHPLEESDLLLSRDGGLTWQDIRGDLDEYASARSLALSAFDERLYISGGMGTFAMDLAPTQADGPPVARLLASYPNPFNPKTTIRFSLDAPGRVDLAVYTLSGRRVAALLTSAPLPAGEHAVIWEGKGEDGRSLASGIYLCRLATNGLTQSATKLALMK